MTKIILFKGYKGHY